MTSYCCLSVLVCSGPDSQRLFKKRWGRREPGDGVEEVACVLKQCFTLSLPAHRCNTVREPLIQRSRDLFLPSDSLRHLSHQLLTFEVGSNGAVSFSWLKICFCLRQFTTSNDTILQKNTKKRCFSYFYLIFAKVSSVYKKNMFCAFIENTPDKRVQNAQIS